MELTYLSIQALCIFILLLIYIDKKISIKQLTTLILQIIIGLIILIYDLKDYPYVLFTIYSFVYLICIYSINLKLNLKDIVFTFTCILSQHISLLILSSLNIEYFHFISSFITLCVGYFLHLSLKKYKLSIPIKQWWHFVIIGYIQSLSLYCLINIYLEQFNENILILICAFIVISILYVYLFIKIIKEYNEKISFEKNSLRKIHKQELDHVYYDIINKEHQLFYLALSLQDKIQTNQAEALSLINNYIQTLNKTNKVIYSDYSYFNIKFSQLINSYKTKNVDILVYINLINNDKFEDKNFVDQLCLLIENFIVAFYDKKSINLNISQESSFVCLSLYTETAIINDSFIKSQKLLSEYPYHFTNDSLTILKIIIN